MDEAPLKKDNEDMPDWDQYQVHVLSEMRRLSDNIEKVCEKCENLTERFHGLNQELTIIKTKARNIGTAFGFLGSLVYPLLERVIEVLKHKS